MGKHRRKRYYVENYKEKQKRDDNEVDDILALNKSMESLLELMDNEEDPEKKLKYAQTYRTLKEAKDADWHKAKEWDMEDRKSRRNLLGTVIAAICGSAVAGGIKALANDRFQKRAIDAEREDLYVKPQKMLPPNK